MTNHIVVGYDNSPSSTEAVDWAAFESVARRWPLRVVVGLDGSASSDAALVWAADEADLHGVDLPIVHAWEYAYPGLPTHSEQVRDVTESTQRRCSTAPRNSLANAVGCQSRTCWSKVELLPRCWTPVRDGDVLVLGAEGRGAIAAGLIDSTVNSVIEQSAVPVVVVR